ncbi:MAG: 1,4-alpha-glucan-branching enzyme, partial [Bacteroidaceae bacterium]|nr:1,4-alpha-glucan-branching enzyme [Bacteroidaceae bacterium]
MYRLLELNPQLQDFAWDIDYRMQLYRDTKARLLPHGGELNDFASAHNYFGIHHVDGGWVYREWAPNAHQLYLTGDFNNWNWTEYPMLRYGDGCWVLFLEGDNALWEGCKVKT